MVLSLGFIIAFIGAAVALLIGILIFSEVEDAIICPAGAGTPGTPGLGGGEFLLAYYPFNSADPGENLGSGGASLDGSYFEGGGASTFVSTTGPTNLGDAVIQNGTGSGATQGEIRFGSASDWQFMYNLVGSNLTSYNIWVNGDLDGLPSYPIWHAGGIDGSDPNMLWLFTRSTDSELDLREGGEFSGFNMVTVGIPPDDSNWHMVTLTMDKGNTTHMVKYCIDGSGNCEFETANPFDGDGAVGADTLIVGDTCGSCTENTFDVDDFAIWHGYLLTDADIDLLYASGDGAPANSGPGAPGSGGGGTGQGSEECENAKDIAWTVIGILPVALFFALFAIFGALGRTS